MKRAHVLYSVIGLNHNLVVTGGTRHHVSPTPPDRSGLRNFAPHLLDLPRPKEKRRAIKSPQFLSVEEKCSYGWNVTSVRVVLSWNALLSRFRQTEVLVRMAWQGAETSPTLVGTARTAVPLFAEGSVWETRQESGRSPSPLKDNMSTSLPIFQLSSCTRRNSAVGKSKRTFPAADQKLLGSEHQLVQRLTRPLHFSSPLPRYAFPPDRPTHSTAETRQRVYCARPIIITRHFVLNP